ncbi:MAG: hypothetical protein GXY14_00980 [Spirochaetes bacterium]|nr:hypothetical protein [Spirochaetota bacterium]
MSRDELHKSIQSVINDDKPTVRKSIVIGVGGSGMKGVLSAKSWIEENIPAEAHRYMRWVGIDTTDIETSIEGKGGRYRFPSDQFFQEEKRMLYISSPTPAELSLEFLRDKQQNDPCFSWLPNPDVYDISTRAGQGANQTRPLGRLAFFNNEKKIREALIKERDRLDELPDDPKYFQLMDVKEGEDKKSEKIAFTFRKGVNRYYFSEKIPADHIIAVIEPDKSARAILCPHIKGKIDISIFPSDENGHYFEVNGGSLEGRSFTFDVTHFKRGAQISIFITASIVGGTGNGMLLDLAALVRDVFSDYWPKPRIYGIVVLPSAFKRVVYNRNARANAYAALKEIDYFMSGNTFTARYPSGRTVEIKDRLFDDGMLYLLDIDNMAGNSLQGRDQVQELTGQFISTFVSSIVGGAIEERTVNDSTRASVYLPADEKSQRRASYNSFGISRVIYPVPHLKDIGYRIIALKMIEAFTRQINSRLLLETIGDINRGLVRALRLDCRLIFERMYPDYRADIEVEMRSYSKKLDAVKSKGDRRSVVSLMESVIRDYGKEEMEKIRHGLMARMEKRYRIELDKMRTVAVAEIHRYMKDPNMGFNFAGRVIDLLLAKLEIYQKKYYQERVGLARYSTEEMEKLVDAAGASPDTGLAEAVIQMASFNFEQMVYESMLSSAEIFVREFKSLLFNIRNNEINMLMDKVAALRDRLKQEVEEKRFELLEKKNPLFFYLINGREIGSFLEKHFYSRLSIEDLCNEVDFVRLDREDDTAQFIETYLISTEGLHILEMGADEIRTMITERFGHLLDKPIDQVRSILFDENQPEAGLQLSETSMLRVDIEIIRKKLFKIIYSRFEGFSFDNISIRDILAEKNVSVSRLLERLDSFSRPYIFIDPAGLNSMEYYRVITNFELNNYEEGDDPAATSNDLPPRLNHYRKRESAIPNISVETFEVPNLCKPYEMISIGILLGYPIFRINSLAESARDYHDLVAERSHPLHLFNSPEFDAKYFPDPFRNTNYLNPARLWTGLVLLKVLQQRDGAYHFEDKLTGALRDIEARENYRRVVIELEARINSAGGFDKITPGLLAETVTALGMLAKNPADGKLQFRKEYSMVIMDILDGDGTGDKATAQNMSKDEYIEKFLKSPKFSDSGELEFFFENERAVREFITESVKSALERTKGNITAGADISLPRSKVEHTEVPVFKDKYEFYDYFEKRGSLEWQNVLRERLTDRLHEYVSSSRFRLESDPTLVDRTKVAAFLQSLELKMPDIVLWEVKVRNRVIK